MRILPTLNYVKRFCKQGGYSLSADLVDAPIELAQCVHLLIILLDTLPAAGAQIADRVVEQMREFVKEDGRAELETAEKHSGLVMND